MPTTEDAKHTPGLGQLRTLFAGPPRQFGILPFWTWNDALEESELLRQIHEMHAAGFGGFVPMPDLGLSRDTGYLAEEYFRLLRLCVQEAASLGMIVILYDEGCYPSGSAQGRVVANNPDHAARCLFHVDKRVTGPARGHWRPNPGRALCDELVSVIAARETGDGSLDPDSLALMTPAEHEVVPYDLPEGDWLLIACWQGYSGGTIRGVFAEEDDGHALAPAAGDILNPDAVASFLHITHDAYYEHLSDYFGSTIVAMFTDEPGPLGRAPKRRGGPQPFTRGFQEDVQQHWDDDVARWLPTLWYDVGPRTDEFRQAYQRAVHERLERVFYRAQSEWCVAHGIVLTGHPSASDEIEALRAFGWPGQDMVWRYVVPDSPTALEGNYSVGPKCAGSIAALTGAERNISELFGAYGWRLSLDETKWLFDWHLARGTNLFVTGSFKYSARGRRAYNSEPAIGMHNVWWPYYDTVAGYVRRLGWMLTQGREVADVAILTDPSRVAWQAAKELYRNQIGFVYIEPYWLEQGHLDGAQLVIGQQRFSAVVCDPGDVSAGSGDSLLRAFAAAGGLVVRDWDPNSLVHTLDAHAERDVIWSGADALRALHRRVGNIDLYLLVNEGEDRIEGDLSLRACGALEIWDPLDGVTIPWPSRDQNGRTLTRVSLERRQGLVVAVDPTGSPDDSIPFPDVPGDALLDVAGLWTVHDTESQPVSAPAPGDWAHAPGLETFSGTLCYRTEVDVPAGAESKTLFLDLGQVGDIAEVRVNGDRGGVRCWAPYVVNLTGACQTGRNSLEIRITNSIANERDGLQLPSGLIGPIRLRSSATVPPLSRHS